jgi:mobilome CxxCx(11)CxxC protein
MDDQARRQQSWDRSLHAEGTRVVFDRRATGLRQKIKLRDFTGLAVPILLAYLLGSEVFEPLKHYRATAVGLLGVTAVMQTLLVAWSLLARWDEELAYNVTAARESYMLKQAWKKLAQGDTQNLAVEYDLLSHQQSLADSRDIEKGITEREMKIGMRAGLIDAQRKCVCGNMPTGRGLPWMAKQKCAVCGGN